VVVVEGGEVVARAVEDQADEIVAEASRYVQRRNGGR
jgi:hypothetical protein